MPGTDPHPVVALTRRHLNPAFVRLLGVFGYGRVYTRAEGVWVYDVQGRRYLDLLAGFGSVNVGHNHPRLADRIRRFLDEKPLNLAHTGPSPYTALLAARLAAEAGKPLTRALLASSGAEAVEAGMKLARVVTDRSRFAYCKGGFHGTNLGTLSIMGGLRMRAPFEPLLQGCVEVPFGDLPALEAVLSKRDVAAFVVEPILGEGGVVLPPPDYLRRVRELCTRTKTLLVLDEVQTGLGRTGTMFAFQREGVVPDVLVLAKALSGSLTPISVAMTTEVLHDKAYGSMDRFDLHSSTFEGNALSCAVALETLDILKDEDLVARAAARGEQILVGLRARLSGHPFIRDIRGRGLLVGIELGPTDRGWTGRIAPALVKAVSRQLFGQWAALRLLEQGVLCQPAAHAWDVLKLEPPLTISEEEVALAIDRVASVFEAYPTLTPLLTDMAQRVGRQAARGWELP